MKRPTLTLDHIQRAEVANIVFQDVWVGMSPAEVPLFQDILHEFDVIINLYPFKPRGWYPVPEGIEYHEFEMLDVDEIDVPLVEEAVNLVDKAHKQGKRVLVHCQAGINRSAFIVAVWLVAGEGFDPEVAIKLVRGARGGVALINNEYVKYIRGLRG